MEEKTVRREDRVLEWVSEGLMFVHNGDGFISAIRSTLRPNLSFNIEEGNVVVYDEDNGTKEEFIETYATVRETNMAFDGILVFYAALHGVPFKLIKERWLPKLNARSIELEQAELEQAELDQAEA